MRLKTEAAVKVGWPRELKLRARHEVLCLRIPFRRIQRHSSLGRLDAPNGPGDKNANLDKFALSVAIVLGTAATRARAGEGGA